MFTATQFTAFFVYDANNSFSLNELTDFSPALHSIQKSIIWFSVQIRWIVSIWWYESDASQQAVTIHMWCVARFDNICIIQKTWKTSWKVCNFTKSNTPSWVFFTPPKLYKWYQIAESISYFLCTKHFMLSSHIF